MKLNDKCGEIVIGSIGYFNCDPRDYSLTIKKFYQQLLKIQRLYPKMVDLLCGILGRGDDEDFETLEQKLNEGLLYKYEYQYEYDNPLPDAIDVSDELIEVWFKDNDDLLERKTSLTRNDLYDIFSDIEYRYFDTFSLLSEALMEANDKKQFGKHLNQNRNFKLN